MNTTAYFGLRDRAWRCELAYNYTEYEVVNDLFLVFPPFITTNIIITIQHPVHVVTCW